MRCIVLIITFLALTGCATPMMVSNIDITPMPDASFQKVIELSNFSKLQIFEKSKQWMALTFVSAKKVIEYEDRIEGKIIGNGLSTISYVPVVHSAMLGNLTFPVEYDVRYSIVEDIKDGKAKITISNFQLFNKNGGSIGSLYVDGWNQLEPKFKLLCKNLEDYILKPNDGQNW